MYFNTWIGHFNAFHSNVSAMPDSLGNFTISSINTQDLEIWPVSALFHVSISIESWEGNYLIRLDCLVGAALTYANKQIYFRRNERSFPIENLCPFYWYIAKKKTKTKRWNTMRGLCLVPPTSSKMWTLNVQRFPLDEHFGSLSGCIKWNIVKNVTQIVLFSNMVDYLMIFVTRFCFGWLNIQRFALGILKWTKLDVISFRALHDYLKKNIVLLFSNWTVVFSEERKRVGTFIGIN